MLLDNEVIETGQPAERIGVRLGRETRDIQLKGSGPTGQNWSSVVRSGDKLYAVNQAGDAFVWKAAPKFELLATNSLGEATDSSPAVSDGDIFMRTHQSLWCLGAGTK